MIHVLAFIFYLLLSELFLIRVRSFEYFGYTMQYYAHKYEELGNGFRGGLIIWIVWEAIYLIYYMITQLINTI